MFRQILDERRVVFRIKAGIQMDRHDVEPERHDALAPPEHFQQHPAVHAARNGDPDLRAGADHPGALHGLSRAFDADLLRIGELFFRHQDNRILKSS